MDTTVEIPTTLRRGDELYIVFNVTRGKPSSVRGGKAAGLEIVRESPAQEFTLPSNVLRLACRKDVSKKRLKVDSAIEAVEVVKTIHRDRRKKKLVVHTMTEEDGSPRLVAEHPDRTEFLRDEILDPARYEAEVTAALDDLRVFRDYFWELDRRTHTDLIHLSMPSSLDRSFHLRAVEITMSLLVERLADRARKRKARAPLSRVGRAVREDDVPYLKCLSDVQLQLIRKHFAIDNSEGLARFERAYEMFANGELGLYLPQSGAWTCEPSSGYYFLFAEFALLATDPATPLAAALGEDRALWERLCNVLVRTQEIFCRVYAPRRTRKRDFASYTATNYFGTRAPLGVGDKADLRRRFEGATLDSLARAAADNVVAHLPGVL